MKESNCVGCGRTFFVLGGHSCGDSESTQEVRRLLAREIETRMRLEDGIKALDEMLLPIAKHIGGGYNTWRKENPKTLNYVEAGKLLVNYVQRRLQQIN